MKKLLFLFAVMLTFGGCAGGGGSVHLPPKDVRTGAAIELALELSVWGAGSGRLDARYTEIKCHFRDTAKVDYQVAPARVLDASDTRMDVAITIPAGSIVGASEVEYYFDFLFDGIYNRREGARIKILK